MAQIKPLKGGNTKGGKVSEQYFNRELKSNAKDLQKKDTGPAFGTSAVKAIFSGKNIYKQYDADTQNVLAPRYRREALAEMAKDKRSSLRKASPRS